MKLWARFSPVWLIPIVAAGLVVYLGYSSFQNRGPTVTLSLATADGLTVDETKVEHKAVTVGTVQSITLAKDMKSVLVKIAMEGGTTGLLTDHARFWVVRPRLSAHGLTGIETLVSGVYIEVDPGEPGGKKKDTFTALPQPPGRESDEPGRTFDLEAKRLGALAAGSPVFYRDVEVGEVLSYDLGAGLGPVTLRVFVRDPYDKFVHPQTRFWNASGISVSMGAEGMHIELESLQTLLTGGIAFETPHGNEGDAPAAESTKFQLFDDKAAADSAFYRENIPYVTYFHASVQGLARGSPVVLWGVQVGSVRDVRLVYDDGRLVARVAFDLQPERVLVRNDGASVVPDNVRQALRDPRMRVRLESSSLFTGSKDLAIVYGPGRGAEVLPREGDSLVLPSDASDVDAMMASLSDVATKLDKIPFEQIGQNANEAMARLPGIADQVSLAAKNAGMSLGPAGYGRDSDFQRNLERLMGQMTETVRSFRVLADDLDRHPESILRGRSSHEVTR